MAPLLRDYKILLIIPSTKILYSNNCLLYTSYNNNYHDKEDESVLRTMARYTPNFDKEVWKYLGLEILGIEEFDWK